MERSGSLCGRVAAPRETQHGSQCCTIEKKLLAGAPWRSNWPGHRCCTIGKQLPAEKSQGTIGKNLKSTRKPHTELLVEESEEDSIVFCNFGGKM